MVDRSIPYYNVIMRCRQYEPKTVCLPDGYKITLYRPGDEKSWARMEHSVGDFETEQAAEAYFANNYLSSGDTKDIFFLKDASEKAVGSCMAWTGQRGGSAVNLLHWLIVDEASRKHGLGRALCETVKNRFYEKNGNEIYLHTQPWSFAAILLYVSEGFKLTKKDTFGAYTNQYPAAMQTLRPILTPEQYALLLENSEE